MGGSVPGGLVLSVCTGWVGGMICTGRFTQHVVAKRKKNYFYYPCCKKSISTRFSLQSVPIPSARSVEFILSGTHWTG